MTRARSLDALLLLLVAGSLLFGGGLGCDPVVDGVKLRPAGVPLIPGDKKGPQDWYMGISGKKAPGTALLALPYPVTAPFGIEARMGVFLDEALLETVGAKGCIGFRRSDGSDHYELCVRYESAPPATVISSNLDGSTASCNAATKAELELSDDGVDVIARYRCPGGSLSTLATVASRWESSVKWNAFAAAAGLQKGGQIGFDDFEVSSNGEFSMDPEDPEAEPAFYTFESWRKGLESFYALEDGKALSSGNLLFDALANVRFAATKVEPGFAAQSDAGKLLAKSEKTHEKLLDSGGGAKFFKGFPKLAALNACALEAFDAGL